MNTIAVSPFRCRVWSLHPRADESLTEDSCRVEIASFEEHGQLMPALGRRLREKDGHDIEIVYGARRLFVARCLNRPLLVELRDLSDREAIIAMDLENRLRRDISAYERGTSYARWLEERYFESQDELAKVLRLSSSRVSRLLKLARLPGAILEAFGRPGDICEAWGAELANVIENPERRQRVLQVAGSIAAAASRPPLRQIFEQLRAVGKADRPLQVQVQIRKAQDGHELFRVKQRRSSTTVTVPLYLLSATTLAAVEGAIARVLDPQL